MGFGNVFHELSVVLLFAAAVGAVGLVLRQPLVVSFIAAGILAGPSVLDIATAAEHLDVLAQFGIAILLFVVGLKLDLHLIRTTGPVALTTGLGQVLFTSVIGFFICLALGLEPLASLYVAVAITFSSTIIIVKLLSDKGEIDALHGRVALGFLIVQDIVVVLVMVIASALAAGQGDAAATGGAGIALRVAEVLGKGVLMVGIVAVFIRFLARPTFDRVARSPELMVLLAVGLAVAFASGAELLGFSMELGAFLAGIALASTPYRDVIGARLNPLRDFMLLFFFISLGSHMDLASVGDQILPALALSAFVLIGNPLIVLIIMGIMGYRKRTGFLAGLTVAQISEFSLIFMAMGLSLGHVSGADMGLVTLVGIVTIGLSTYMILYSHRLYSWLEPVLTPFERKLPHRESGAADSVSVGAARPQVIVFGLGRYGSNIIRGLGRREISVLGVDFDPEVVRERRAAGWTVVYGDASDPDFAKTLPLSTAEWVILAVPAVRPVPGATDPNEMNIRSLRAQGFTGRIAVTAHSAANAARLKRAGADLVLHPYADAARRAVEVITGTEPRETAAATVEAASVKEVVADIH